MRKRVGVVRLALAAALAVALIASAAAAEAVPGARHDFLAYFAAESSIVAVAAWALSGAFLLARSPAPAWVHVLRGAAVSYGLVLASCRLLIALPWQASGGFPLPAVNVLVTLVVPVLLLADWILVGDRRPLSASYLRWVAAFPVLWSTITLLRGIQTDWTPYPLLDPATAGIRLPLYLGGTGLVALGAGMITSWLSRREALLPMDRAAAAVDAAPAPLLGGVPLEPPVDLPSVPTLPTVVSAEPVGASSVLDEPAAPLQAFRFVDPPPISEPGTTGRRSSDRAAPSHPVVRGACSRRP